MWVGTNSGLKSFDGYDFKELKSTATSPNLLPNNTVLAICEDHDEHLWIGTRNGLVKLNLLNGQMQTYQAGQGISRIIYTIFTSHDGRVWVGSDAGLSVYDTENDTFVNFRGGQSVVVLPNGKRTEMGWYSVKSIVEDYDGNLYIGTWDSGLLRFSPSENLFYSYPKLNERNSAYSLLLDSKQRLWVGTWGFGFLRIDNPLEVNDLHINSYNRGEGSFDTFYSIIEDPITQTIWAATREGIVITSMDGDLTNAKIYSTYNDGIQQLRFCNNILTDKHGNVWIETLNDGIVHFNTQTSPFSSWRFADNGYSLPVNSVCSVFFDDNDEVWLSMKPYGIVRIDKATGMAQFNYDIPGFEQMDHEFMGTSITSIRRHSNGEIWMANNSYGIAAYRQGKPVRHITVENSAFLTDNYVNTLMLSRDGAMWVGQGKGLVVALSDNSGVELKLTENGRDFSSCDVRGLSEDSKGNIWVATEDKGIIRIIGNSSVGLSKVICHRYCPANNNYVVNDATTCLEDSKHRLWAISNSGGLFLLDEKNDIFVSVNERYNIPGDRIFSIVEDQEGSLWLAADNALIRFRPDDDKPCTIFGEDDGLSNMLFFPNASCKYNNTLFFACQTGFSYFDASQIKKDKTDYPKHNLILTDILLDGVRFAQIDSAMRHSVSDLMPTYTTNITIPSSVNKFSLVFALLSYSNLTQTSYSYMLEDYDANWKQVAHGDNMATFENIPSGSYTFRLRATDAYGNVTYIANSVSVTILPPWYASHWAIVIYIVLLILMVFAYVKWYQHYMQTRNRLQMATVLTNITHELLTPMAVISATIDELRSTTPEQSSRYQLIQHNITRLTRLLRQILEVRKSQAGQLRLLVSKGNLSDFVENTCKNISPIISRKDCSLRLNIEPNIEAWFDSDKMDKILYNLLSNAQKYNKQGGVVTVILQRSPSDVDSVQLTISDEGVGISPQRMKHLYSPFFDGDYRRTNQTGTGIGLSLTHELVLLHHGTISCKSKVNEGTTFTITLPTNNDAYYADEIDNDNFVAIDEQYIDYLRNEPVQEADTTADEQYHLLLVEDNDELLEIMERMLSPHYHVLTARNGKQALGIIEKEELDIVVSDVMMPIMDGNELTRIVKNNPDYCQLPIVLLTAKVRDEDRAEGLSAGADDYLTKPFDLNELKIRIDNIIANRERVKQRFSQATVSSIVSQLDEHISSPGEVFLQKAIACVERNISNSDYDRETFASDMCVSSSTLYNKLRALTGNSITGFITSVRLKNACIIARQNPHMGIAELSEKVGFSTPKYFSKCFKKEYGMLLREYLVKTADA